MADVITLAHEIIDESEPYEIFHPEYIWKRKLLEDFTVRKLQVPIFVQGQCVYQYVYREPIRYLNGNIYECRRNIIRYPKKCRSLRTWRKFYEMFPRQAEIDGWDGKTSIRMK